MEIRVKTKTHEYPIIVERGCLKNLVNFIDSNRKVMIITEKNIPNIDIDCVKSQFESVYVTVLNEGESTKSVSAFSQCIENLLKHQFNRHDLVIGLGGGVIGDLSGYVASSYLRGIDFVNIPTSSLAQIDSSIGGKVAINHLGIKNCIGSFYPPIAVFIDFDVLASLDSRNLYNGLIEALKAGLIDDPILYNLFKTNQYIENLDEVILRALLVKRKLVEEDEFEKGNRKLLNLGHTLGHAFESAGHFTTYLHGEAVALGIIPMIDDQELKKEVENILENFNIVKPNYQSQEIATYLSHDKKSEANSITTVRVKEVGCCYFKKESIEACIALMEDNYG